MGLWDDISNVNPRSLPPPRHEGGGPYSSLLGNADWDKAAMLLSPMPVVGDVAGLAADVHQYYTDPSLRTPMNFGLTLAGMLPFIPGAKVVDIATKMTPKFKSLDKVVYNGVIGTVVEDDVMPWIKFNNGEWRRIHQSKLEPMGDLKGIK